MNKSSLPSAAIIPTPGLLRALALITGALVLAAPAMARADVIAPFDAVVAIDGGSKETSRTLVDSWTQHWRTGGAELAATAGHGLGRR